MLCILTFPWNYYVARQLCQNANWWSSFSAAGWSKCPKTSPYIKGFFRSTVLHHIDDGIGFLKDASCCNNNSSGTFGDECVQANWSISFKR